MSAQLDVPYRGLDWREALSRNVTVSLAFAVAELAPYEDEASTGRALALIGDALAECNRLLATLRPEERCTASVGREGRCPARATHEYVLSRVINGRRIQTTNVGRCAAHARPGAPLLRREGTP
jgi:hypothetical protein